MQRKFFPWLLPTFNEPHLQWSVRHCGGLIETVPHRLQVSEHLFSLWCYLGWVMKSLGNVAVLEETYRGQALRVQSHFPVPVFISASRAWTGEHSAFCSSCLLPRKKLPATPIPWLPYYEGPDSLKPCAKINPSSFRLLLVCNEKNNSYILLPGLIKFHRCQGVKNRNPRNWNYLR